MNKTKHFTYVLFVVVCMTAFGEFGTTNFEKAEMALLQRNFNETKRLAEPHRNVALRQCLDNDLVFINFVITTLIFLRGFS